MRYTKSLACCAIALSLVAACGDKKKKSTSGGSKPVNPINDGDATAQPPGSEWVATESDLPACETEGKIAWVDASKTLFMCHSNQWVRLSPETSPTPQPTSTPSQGDNSGSGDTVTFEVVDANGVKLGVTDFSGYVKSLDQSAFAFMLADGAIFKVSPANGGFAGDQCFFEATDCSSTCLFPTSPAQKQKIIQGANGFHKITGDETRSARTFNAYQLGDYPLPVCAALGSPQSSELAELTTIYQFATGVAYPFAAPIAVKPRP